MWQLPSNQSRNCIQDLLIKKFENTILKLDQFEILTNFFRWCSNDLAFLHLKDMGLPLTNHTIYCDNKYKELIYGHSKCHK